MSTSEEQLSLGAVVDIDLERARRWRAEMVRAARQSGEARSIVPEDSDWVDAVFEYLERLPSGAETNADRIRALFGASRATGAILAKARRAGLIVAIGVAESESPSRHSGLIRLWARL